MANKITPKYYLGAAKVYGNIDNETQDLLPLFNCSSVKITASEKETVLNSSMDAEAGPLATVYTLDKMNIELTCNSIHKENIAFFLKGTTENVVSGTVTDEVLTFTNKGTLVKLAHFGATDVVIKNAAGTVTYDEGVDYEMSGSGPIILEDSAIVSGAKASYSYPETNVVQAFKRAPSDVSILIDGINIAEESAPCQVLVHKVKFTIADSIDFVSKDFVSITIKGTILKDPTKGSGESGYYKYTDVVKA